MKKEAFKEKVKTLPVAIRAEINNLLDTASSLINDAECFLIRNGMNYNKETGVCSDLPIFENDNISQALNEIIPFFSIDEAQQP